MTLLSSGSTLLFLFVAFQVWRVEAKLPRFPNSLIENDLFDTSHNPETDRIVGGELAQRDQFPHQASLQSIRFNGAYSHFCGGCIVGPKTIVTAGHCARGQKPEKVVVYVGDIHLDGNGTHHKVAKVVAHPEYDHSTISNDIAVYQLEEPINFGTNAAPIELDNNPEIKSDAISIVSGWGTLKEGGSIPNQLRFVDVPTRTDEDCKKSYGVDEITSTMFCAGGSEGGKDSCQGDSGGPLIYAENHKLMGIVSWGYGCARQDYPGVYTKVNKFVKWIQNFIDE